MIALILFVVILFAAQSAVRLIPIVGGLMILAGGADLILVNIVKGIFSGRNGDNATQRPIRWITRIKLPVLLKILWRPLLGTAAAAAVLFSGTFRDEFFYAAGILDLALAIWSAVDLIRQHNLLTSREIPVFTMKRGGDQRG